jgi:hypothetical protein
MTLGIKTFGTVTQRCTTVSSRRLSTMTFSIKILTTIILSVMAFCIKTLCRMTLSIKAFDIITCSVKDGVVYSVIMLGVIKLSVITL